jgi:hypothetical protein
MRNSKQSAQCVLAMAVLCVSLAATVGAQSGVESKKIGAISLSLRALQTDIAAGSPVDVVVRFANNSDREISDSGVYNRGVDAAYTYDIRKADGTRLNPMREPETAGRPVLLSGVSRTVKPGKSVEDKSEISAVYDLSEPGKYTIQVSYFFPKELGGGLAKSNIVTVTVVPVDKTGSQ